MAMEIIPAELMDISKEREFLSWLKTLWFDREDIKQTLMAWYKENNLKLTGTIVDYVLEGK